MCMWCISSAKELEEKENIICRFYLWTAESVRQMFPMTGVTFEK